MTDAPRTTGKAVGWAVVLTVLALLPSLLDWTDVRLAITAVVGASCLGGRRAALAGLITLSVGYVLLGSVAITSDASVVTLVIQALIMSLVCVALIRVIETTFDDGSARRPAQRLLLFLSGVATVAIVGSVVEFIVVESIAEDTNSPVATTAIGIGIAAGIAGLFAVRRASPISMVERFGAGELLAPLLVVIMTLAAIQITRQIGEQRDRDRLDRVADVARNVFVDEVGAELTLASVKLEAASQLVVSEAGQFSAEFQPFIDTRSSLVAVALVSSQGNGPIQVETLAVSGMFTSGDELGRALEDNELSTQGISSGSLTALQPLEVLVRPDEKLPLLTFLAPLNSDNPDLSRSAVFIYSIPALLQSALERSLEDTQDIALSLERIVGGVGVGLVRAEQVSGDVVSTSDFSIGAETYRFLVQPVSAFGTDPEVMALILVLEAIFGAAILAVLLRGANSQFTMSLERRRRESLLEAALDATPGISVVFDENFTVLTANRSIRDQFADAIPGLPVTTLFGLRVDSGRERLILDALQAALDGTAGHAELAEDGADNAMKIMEIETYPVSGPGEVRVGFLHAVDATERRSVAMRSAQSERMESLGSLAGGLAHDFNNLLFVTLGNLQLMAMNEVIAQDEKLSKFVSRSMTAVERGAEITKSLLAVARSQPLEESAVSLSDLVKGLLPLVRQALGAGRRVEVDIQDPTLQLMVDAGRLSSCILNLAFNSRDAMGPTGTLRITGRLVEESGMIELSVADDGAGMPAEIVARAFEPFFTTKSPGSGTGLGLATVYAFAKQSGGTAYLESRPGLGTTVTLVLPQYRGEVRADQTVVQRRAGRRVVVADDEQSLAEMVASWLIDMGIDARFAMSPKSALELIEEFEPDVLVSDANFGEELDGIELARLGTAIVPEMAVVFMTGFSNSMRELQELGERTLAKPFSREDLYAALSPLIAEEPAARNETSTESPQESS